MTQNNTDAAIDHVQVQNATGASCVVLVCEHASRYIPAVYNNLGLSPDDLVSHAAWDPGAMEVATLMANHLGGALVASGVSRLVYDCNRPPDAPDAMPARSEVVEVPGNRDLSQSDRSARVSAVYQPFHNALAAMIRRTSTPIIVTVHSFTPTYFGTSRSVEIGILHDSDTRLADAMLQTAGAHTTAHVRRNEPYGPTHGVTHTLKEHAIGAGHLNVMLEVRNDLIKTPDQQHAMAATLAGWIADACAQLDMAGVVKCQA